MHLIKMKENYKELLPHFIDLSMIWQHEMKNDLFMLKADKMAKKGFR